jgi:hypothetical protein
MVDISPLTRHRAEPYGARRSGDVERDEGRH